MNVEKIIGAKVTEVLIQYIKFSKIKKAYAKYLFSTSNGMKQILLTITLPIAKPIVLIETTLGVNQDQETKISKLSHLKIIIEELNTHSDTIFTQLRPLNWPKQRKRGLIMITETALN